MELQQDGEMMGFSEANMEKEVLLGGVKMTGTSGRDGTGVGRFG